MKEVNVKCTERLIPEGPELLFGMDDEHKKTFFDATKALSSIPKEKLKSINGFQVSYRLQLNQLCDSYEILSEDILFINAPDKHILIDTSFAILFLCYIDDKFLSYVCNRIEETFYRGVSLSNQLLVDQLKDRFTKEEILKIYG